MKKDFVVKGNFITSKSKDSLKVFENSYLVCLNGVIDDIYLNLPEKFLNLDIIDYSNKIIISGLIDLHVHAPQYTFRGLGMDLELLDWLNKYTFPEESKYINIDYAKKAYSEFVDDLKKSSTTRACIFATVHNQSTIMLMDMLDKTNLKTFVGKVNMDRNSPQNLCEQSCDSSLNDTINFIEKAKKFKNCGAIITPRFTPSCSDDLMKMLGNLKKQTGLPMQSHLSENKSEIEWVKSLCPTSRNYADTYNSVGLLGENAVLAHCVYCTQEEVEILKQTKTYIAHCPQSNVNLASGIAPIRYYLQNDLNIGLGSDVAGGANLSIFRAITDAIGVSKLYMRLISNDAKPLCFSEAFYLATAGAGKFFGNVGKLEKGYKFDAVVLCDDEMKNINDLSLIQRLERIAYHMEDRAVFAKYVEGVKI